MERCRIQNLGNINRIETQFQLLLTKRDPSEQCTRARGVIDLNKKIGQNDPKFAEKELRF